MFENTQKTKSEMNLQSQPVDDFTKRLLKGSATSFESATEVIREQGISDFSVRTLGALMRKIESYIEIDEEITPFPVRDLLYDKDVTLGSLVAYSDLVGLEARDIDVGNSLEYFERADLPKSEIELYKHVLEAVIKDSNNDDVTEAVTLRLARLDHIASPSPKENILIENFEKEKELFLWSTTGDCPGGLPPLLPEDTSASTYVLLSHAAESGPFDARINALNTLRHIDLPYEMVVEESLRNRGKL
jgi:hypothetical protein